MLKATMCILEKYIRHEGRVTVDAAENILNLEEKIRIKKKTTSR
jgi:hypothetical protein